MKKTWIEEVRCTAVELVIYGGYSCLEVAQAFGVDESAVEQWQIKLGEQVKRHNSIVDLIDKNNKKIKEIDDQTQKLKRERTLLEITNKAYVNGII